MNFLSHYYLHLDKKDNYYTVGLTMPDVLGFLSTRIRITANFLKSNYAKEKNNNIKSFISGMYVHILIDRWFHSLGFFKENIFFIQDFFRKYNKNESELSDFYSHIILEILIDRFLLIKYPTIVDDFYISYKNFNFNEVLELFSGFSDFDPSEFLSFAIGIANSSFLREYVDDDSIMSILKRVSNRINIPFELKVNKNIFAGFINNIYIKLEPSIKELLKNAKENLIFNKVEIFNENF